MRMIMLDLSLLLLLFFLVVIATLPALLLLLLLSLLLAKTPLRFHRRSWHLYCRRIQGRAT